MITIKYWTFQYQAQPHDYQPILDLSEQGSATGYQPILEPFRNRPSHMITSHYFTFQNQAQPQDITSQYLTFQNKVQPHDYQPIMDLTKSGSAPGLPANTGPFRIRPIHMITSPYFTFQNQVQPILDLSNPCSAKGYTS